jgi:hypothetical protein
LAENQPISLFTEGSKMPNAKGQKLELPTNLSDTWNITVFVPWVREPHDTRFPDHAFFKLGVNSEYDLEVGPNEVALLKNKKKEEYTVLPEGFSREGIVTVESAT